METVPEFFLGLENIRGHFFIINNKLKTLTNNNFLKAISKTRDKLL